MARLIAPPGRSALAFYREPTSAENDVSLASTLVGRQVEKEDLLGNQVPGPLQHIPVLCMRLYCRGQKACCYHAPCIYIACLQSCQEGAWQ